MQLAVAKLLKDPESRVNRVFHPKPEELSFEGIDFTSKQVRVSVELQKIDAGIFGNLQVDCELSLECGRCVERSGYIVSAVRQVEYVVNPTPEVLQSELNGWFVSQYDGETVVLDEDVRQMLILAMPTLFLCREDCRGLCVHCGANLNAGPCECPKTAKAPLKSVSADSPFQAAFDKLKKRKKL